MVPHSVSSVVGQRWLTTKPAYLPTELRRPSDADDDKHQHAESTNGEVREGEEVGNDFEHCFDCLDFAFESFELLERGRF